MNLKLAQLTCVPLVLALCLQTSLAADTSSPAASGSVPSSAASDTSTEKTALDQVIAVMDNDVILASDIQQAVGLLLARNNLGSPTPDQLDRIKLDVFRQIALRKLQLGLADRMGVTVDENTLNEAVLNYARQQGLSSIPELEQQLNAQGPEMYFTLREQVSDEIKISRLRQQQVSARVKITEKDVDNFLASPESQLLIQPEYRVMHVTLDQSGQNPKTARSAMLAAQQIHAALLEGKTVEEIAQQFGKTRESVNIQMSDWVSIKQFPAVFADALKPLDKDGVTRVIETPGKLNIFKVADRRGGDHTMVDQWKVRHILVAPTENLTASDAKTRINNIYDALKRGEDFSQLAKTYSNDPGSARTGGNLGWVSPGDMVPSFEEAITRTPTGQYSPPFQSPFGWHVLQVQEIRKQDMTEQYRRNAARRILFDRKFDQEYENWLRELKNISYINVRDKFYNSAW